MTGQCPITGATEESLKAKISESQFKEILCPNLRIGVKMGHLHPDKDGWVKSAQMRKFLGFIGFEPLSAVVDGLISASEKATDPARKGFIHITAFKGTNLDHGSSSGTLNNPEGFSEPRLEHLKSFANQDGRLYQEQLVCAAKNFNACPFNFASKRGQQIQLLEMATILDAYGRFDGGKRYFTTDDIDALWRENRFPDKWQATSKPVRGTGRSLWNMIVMNIRRLFGQCGHKDCQD